REVPLLRYVFEVSESDELTSYGNQAEQAQCSIHTGISRDRRQCYEIPEARAGGPSRHSRSRMPLSMKSATHTPLGGESSAYCCSWGLERCLSFLAPIPTAGGHVDEIHKNAGGMKPSGNFSLSCDIK